jgi:hypothetical protein
MEGWVDCWADGEEVGSVGDGVGIWHMAKEQKLRAFTSKVCKSQGCFLCDLVSSMGRSLEKSASSDSRSCHTSSLLSRPCLVEMSVFIRQPRSARRTNLGDYVFLFQTPATDPKH